MLHRRDAMIRLGQVALGTLTLPKLLAARESSRTGRNPSARASAQSCILVYLWGGPPQHDTFDPKADAPDCIRSQFSTISTAIPGINICDQLPQIAKQTDKMAIIRSFTHPSNQHEVGVYHTLTGKVNNTLVVPRNQRNRRDFPTMGSTVSYFHGPGDLPASATIPRPIGHDGVIYSGTYAGFLGPQYDPLELQAPAEVQERAAHGLELPAGWDAHCLQSRVGLLKTLEQYDRLNQDHAHRVQGLGLFREQAFRMLTSSAAKDAFDLSKEPDKVRDRYGRNEYGECFLLARRLIEAGVRLVTFVWYYVCKDGNVANVWDNHGGTGSLGGITGYQMLKEKYCLPPLDQGYSALLEDLADRQRLDDTLVAMLGEFGRTPKINANAGRDHWGACQSVVLAGGGIRGGQVYGASDKTAAYPTDRPVRPEDLIATVYHGLGIAPDAMLYDQQNRPHRACEGEPVLELFG
jgi:Protein of unknown function (DUF1501)